MTNPNDQNALDFVRAKNKDKLYQATLKEVQENQKEKSERTQEQPQHRKTYWNNR